MGTSRTPDELAAKLFHAGDGINKATKDALAKSALLVKVAVVGQLGGVTRLRGVGGKGARIGVRFDVRSDGPVQVVEVKATGPFQLIERDTAPHEIGPKKKRALVFAGGDVRAFVAHHPGTKGKHPFAKGVAESAPLVPRVMAEEQVAGLLRIFK